MGRILSTSSSAAISLAQKFRNDRRLYFTPGTFTYVVPSDVYTIFGIVFGAGGSGGIMSGSTPTMGGAGGGYAQGEIIVTPGQSITVTVGAGGAARSGSSAGLAGGTSSIGTFLSATGGAGGSISGTQASGGTGSASGVTSAVTFSGGNSLVCTGQSQASGGASSGNPFGNGKTNGVLDNNNAGGAGGGAGWGANQPTHTVATPMGGGSIARASVTSVNASVAALGANGWFLAGGTSTTGDANGRSRGLLTQTEAWWFPWEADGSGGYATQTSNGIGGRGGFGSGGGGVYVATGSITGGDGGFGGGGGAASNNATNTVIGGNGGVGGGGGGGARSLNPSSNNFSGAGGGGAVLIYW